MPVCMFCIEHHKTKNIPHTLVPEGHIDGQVIELNDDNFDEIVIGSNQVW